MPCQEPSDAAKRSSLNPWPSSPIQMLSCMWVVVSSCSSSCSSSSSSGSSSCSSSCSSSSSSGSSCSRYMNRWR